MCPLRIVSSDKILYFINTLIIIDSDGQEVPMDQNVMVLRLIVHSD